jgi:ribosomal protein L30E
MTTAPARPVIRPAANPFTHPVVVPVPAVTDVKADFVVITPDIAREMLRRNTHNRPIREARVNGYARVMTSGDWHNNGEAIKIAVDGTILDGQHRLLAVVKSGATVVILVVSNLPVETQSTMDGGAKRNAGDVFALRGEQNSTMLGSVSRKVWLWDRGDRRFSAKESPTTPELYALVDKYPGLRRSADVAVRVYHNFRYIPPSVVGAAHHLCSRIDADEAAWFYEALGTGAELSLRHPVLTLRKRVMTDKDNKREVTDGLHLAQVLTAWNAVRDGKETLAVIKVPQDEERKAHQVVTPR